MLRWLSFFGALALVGTSIAQAFCRRRLPLALGGAAGLTLMVLTASHSRYRRLDETRFHELPGRLRSQGVALRG